MTFGSTTRLARLVSNESPGPLLVRRLAPATIGLPVLIGLLRLAGERRGLYGATFGVALMIGFSIIGATALLLWTAVSLDRVDAERRRIQELLRRSSEQHRTLARNFPDGAIVLFDRDLRHLVADGMGLAGVGLSSSMMEGRTIWEVFPWDVCAVIEPRYRAALAGEESTFEYSWARRTYLVRVVPVAAEQTGRVWGGAVMVHDISERKQSERELREASERLTKTFDNAPIGEAIVAPDGRWLQVNRALCELVGYTAEELLARTFQDITHRDDLDADLEFVRQMLAGEIRTYQMEKRYLHKRGHTVWVLLSVSLVSDDAHRPLYFISQVQDISERKRAERLEEQLRHAQKLDAIGQLAGGVAHEFNNMLLAIQGHSSLLLGRLEANNPLRHDVEQITRAAERSRSLTQQLLAFGRRQMLQPTLVNLNDVLGTTADLLRPLLGANVELTVAFDPTIGAVWADRAQIEQAIINLVLNARDAIADGGAITVSSGAVDVDETRAAKEGVRAGAHVALAVTDTGTGIDDETRRRMFEPFFTTKEPGSGTGLGLSTVHGIVHQSGGFISVDTEPGRGTTITLLIPRREQAEAELPAEPVRASRAPLAGTALLVEDEPLVRTVCADLLEQMGWRTLTATSGSEALDLLEREPNRVDLLLTDMVMSDMGGRELAQRVELLRPETAVIYMCGYTEERFSRRGERGGAGHFLQKPFAAAELEDTLREALGDRRRGTSSAGLTCVVADDHPSVLEAVVRCLAEGGVNVVARATSGHEALEQIAEHQPQTALLDVAMPDLDGVEATRRIGELAPRTRVLLYTGNGGRELIDDALGVGARGILLKDAPLLELARALQIVAEGGVYIDPTLAGALLPQPTHDEPKLTARERAILGQLAEGQTNEQVAGELSISPDTVQTHVRNAMKKLGADSRTHAVATALRKSLIS